MSADVNTPMEAVRAIAEQYDPGKDLSFFTSLSWEAASDYLSTRSKGAAALGAFSMYVAQEGLLPGIDLTNDGPELLERDGENNVLQAGTATQLGDLLLMGAGSLNHLYPTEMANVINAVRQNVAEEWTNGKLAAIAWLSPFYFSRSFKKYTDTSPMRFVADLRYIKAAELLRTTDLSVTDICCVVGYAALGTFSSEFKDRHGVKPTEYRRQALAGSLGDS